MFLRLIAFTALFLFLSCNEVKPPSQLADLSIPAPTVNAADAPLAPAQPEQAPKPSFPSLEWETETSIPLADPSLMEEGESSDAASLLENATIYYNSSQKHWKKGDVETAFADLDQAYSYLLMIGSDEDPDVLQEKENLRYLISKRTLELFASQQRSVGDLQKAIPLPMNEYVAREIASFQGPERKFFIASYYRSGFYRPMILEALREEGLPEQLSWLPLIESGFQPLAMSRARALGLWQFISSTGYRYGLERTQFTDDRMEPVRSSKAAIRYLQDLHSLFGDWLTALASYNCGEGRVLRVISSQKINYMDRFWDLYARLPSETARYVPRFLATLHIIQDPAKYGIELPELPPAHEYEMLPINRRVSLSALEKEMGLSEKSLTTLNPELRLQVTPDKDYKLKVPVGQIDRARTALEQLPLASIPAPKPKTQVIRHKVRRKETVASIAKKYGISQDSLRHSNGLRSKSVLRVGQTIKILVPQREDEDTSSREVSKASANANQASKHAGAAKTYRVRKGDTLWKIAKEQGVTLAQLKGWNKLGSALHVGQTLIVSEGNGQPRQSAEATETTSDSVAASTTYRVQKGDTLAKIASKHGIDLATLLDINKLNKKSTIHPNQRITIPHK